jgi:hypothetical protein
VSFTTVLIFNRLCAAGRFFSVISETGRSLSSVAPTPRLLSQRGTGMPHVQKLDTLDADISDESTTASMLSVTGLFMLAATPDGTGADGHPVEDSNANPRGQSPSVAL